MRKSVLSIGAVVYVVSLSACGSVGSLPTSDAGEMDSTRTDSDAPPSIGVSCTGLPNTCGIDRDNSCCSNGKIPGGMYYRTYDIAGDGLSGNTSFPATISSFRLDKYEVTVGRFREFVKAGMGTRANPPVTKAGEHPNIGGSGWDVSWNIELTADKVALMAGVKCNPTFATWTDMPGGNENRPINCVTWFEAMAFCAWDGGYLPTEAEWNYAAAGGGEQRAFPWSSPAGSLALDNSRASYFDGTNCVGDGTPDCTITDLVMVGTKPAGDGRWGQSELGGNVLEWVLDWTAPYASSCQDCANLATGTSREIRGGMFSAQPFTLRTGSRSGSPPSSRNYTTGIRCARAP